jgi:hypothetical protein
VAADANGGFVVVWQSNGSSGTDSGSSGIQYSVQGQRYASDGSTEGGEFQVNTYTTSYQRFSSVDAAPDGDFVVTWTSRGSFGTDMDGSVHGQRYGTAYPAPPVPAMSSATRLALAVALLLLGAAYALRRRS